MTDPRRKDMEVAAYSGWETVNLLVMCLSDLRIPSNIFEHLFSLSFD